MKPEDVLKLHEELMEAVENFSPDSERTTDAGKKDALEDFLKWGMAGTFNFKPFVEKERDSQSKNLFGSSLLAEISQITTNAFTMAEAESNKQGVQIGDYETYRQNIIGAYRAALGLQLYKQFFAKEKGYVDLVTEILQTKAFLDRARIATNERDKRVNARDVVNFLIEETGSKINSEFRAFEKSGLSEKSKQTLHDLHDAVGKLFENYKEEMQGILKKGKDASDKFKDFSATKGQSGSEPEKGSTGEKTDESADENTQKERLTEKDKQLKRELVRDCYQASFDFQIEAGKMIRKYQLKTKSDESWKPFLKNLLLIITGLGTIPAIASFISRAATGKYMFFDKRKMRERTEEEMVPEDKLLRGFKKGPGKKSE